MRMIEKEKKLGRFFLSLSLSTFEEEGRASHPGKLGRRRFPLFRLRRRAALAPTAKGKNAIERGKN